MFLKELPALGYKDEYLLKLLERAPSVPSYVGDLLTLAIGPLALTLMLGLAGVAVAMNLDSSTLDVCLASKLSESDLLTVSSLVSPGASSSSTKSTGDLYNPILLEISVKEAYRFEKMIEVLRPFT